MNGYEVGSYEVGSYEWSTILDIKLTLCIYCGIMLVVVNNEACLTRLSPVPEATCSIKCSIPCVSMPDVIEMATCQTFMSHLPNESLLSSGHPHDCHVRFSISNSTSPPASFQAIRVGMTLDSLVFVYCKSHHCDDNSVILFYTSCGSRYGIAIGVFINMIGAFNADFECPAHSLDMF